MSDEKDQIEVAKKSLERVQNFDATSLARTADLGREMEFSEIVSDAERAINLFRLIPPKMFEEIPYKHVREIENQAANTFNIFKEVLDFSQRQSDATSIRESLMQKVKNLYDNIFSNIYPWISYATARSVDFSRIESQARAAAQKIEDRASEMEQRFVEREATLDELIDKGRTSLAEQGVTQQADYFRKEADEHATKAGEWADAVKVWAAVVSVAALASFFTHRIPWIAPQNIAEAVQFIAAKVLLVGALTFMLVRSARNYASHRHNEVVNRHKQNSLLTFEALRLAGSTEETRNIVLNHAAASIYSIPDTGYVRGGSENSSSTTNLVELIQRMPGQLDTSAG